MCHTRFGYWFFTSNANTYASSIALLTCFTKLHMFSEQGLGLFRVELFELEVAISHCRNYLCPIFNSFSVGVSGSQDLTSLCSLAARTFLIGRLLPA